MANQYARIAFTDSVRRAQQQHNSRSAYAGMDRGEESNHRLGDLEIQFIQQRDSFYIASVSDTNWPYVQHRGGPRGFVVALDSKTIGFADFSGNRQYISVGNTRHNNRVALFFMDYPRRRRLKLMGRIEQVAEQDWPLLAKLEPEHYDAVVERAFLIHVEAFDWNCPQHITPRYSAEEIEELMRPLREENQTLRERLNSQSSPSDADNDAWGNGPLPLRVTGILQLTHRVRAYELRHANGGTLPPASAGSHLALPVRLPDNSYIWRHYSICSSPGRRGSYQIAVLCQPQGSGGSLTIHKQLNLGQILHCLPPDNQFALHNDLHPAILIAGGIGITPIKPMAQSLKAAGRMLQIHYAGRSRSEMPFLEQLEHEFPTELFIYPADIGERLSCSTILQNAAKDAHIYVCGPSSLIADVLHASTTLGINPQRIHHEIFLMAKGSGDLSFQIRLIRSAITIHVSSKQTMLDAILEAGVDIPFSCRTGICRTCSVTVAEGVALHRDNCLSDEERNAQKQVCPCVSRSKTEELILDL